MIRRGFSLAEIMVATGLTAVALLAMIGVFVGGLELMSQGDRVTLATEGSRQLVEAIKDGGYASLPALDVVFDGRTNDPPVSGFPPPPYPTVDGLPALVRVEQVRAGLKSVSVQVYWKADRPPVTLETYLLETP